MCYTKLPPLRRHPIITVHAQPEELSINFAAIINIAQVELFPKKISWICIWCTEATRHLASYVNAARGPECGGWIAAAWLEWMQVVHDYSASVFITVFTRCEGSSWSVLYLSEAFTENSFRHAAIWDLCVFTWAVQMFLENCRQGLVFKQKRRRRRYEPRQALFPW